MTLKEKVKKCEKIIGTHVHLTDAAVSEMISYLGFDYIWIDMEHTGLSVKDVYNHMMAAKAGGTPTLIRVPVNDLTYTKRIVEMGPDAIVFPMVKDFEQTKELLDWTLYPPRGKRGCGPKSAVKWGIDDELDFYQNGSMNMCRFIQIETKSAVDDIEKIAKLEYLDGCIFGLFDLSGSIGELGNVFCDKNLAIVKKVISVLKENNKCIGISFGTSDPEKLKFLDSLGINMLTTGFDYGSIIDGARLALKNAKAAQNE